MKIKINIGHTFNFPFSFSQEQVSTFAALTGDTNPLHSNETFAKSTIYGRTILPGFLGGSIFSKVFGTIYPGTGTIYLKQDMKFLKPLYPNEPYVSVYEILSFDPIKKRIVVKTSIVDKENTICLIGEAILQNNNME